MNKSPKMHKCGRCNKTATWLYLPSSSGINFFCDDCVPRGCTCNVMGLDIEEPDEQLSNCTVWWSKETYQNCFENNIDPMEHCTHVREENSYYYEILDEKGRREPCCEFDYSECGFEREHNTYVVKFSDTINVFNKVIKRHIVESLSMAEGIKKLIYDSHHNEEILYNEFMTKVSEFCRPYISHTMFERDRLNQTFYNSFRSQLYDKKYNILSESD